MTGQARKAREIAALLMLAGLAACSATEPDYSKMKVKPRGPGAASEPAPSAGPAPTAAPPPIEATPTELAAQREPEPEAKPEAKKPPRDYALELRQAVGSPTECLKPRLAAEAPSEVTIALEVTVLESGYVSRGDARSGTLDAEELACVKRRIEGARLPPEIEDAPRSVSASITLKLEKPRVQVPSVQEPPPPPPGMVTPPGSTLPALGEPVPRDPSALPAELPPPQATDPNAIPQKLPDPIPLQQ